MGFFSYNCRCCDRALISRYGLDNVPNGNEQSWLEKGVAVYSDGRIVTGLYNGYGTLQTRAQQQESDKAPIRQNGHHMWREEEVPSVYHEECWRNAGCPTQYEPSSRAECQGYFFDSFEISKAKPARKKRRKQSTALVLIQACMVAGCFTVTEFDADVEICSSFSEFKQELESDFFAQLGCVCTKEQAERVASEYGLSDYA